MVPTEESNLISTCMSTLKGASLPKVICSQSISMSKKDAILPIQARAAIMLLFLHEHFVIGEHSNEFESMGA